MTEFSSLGVLSLKKGKNESHQHKEAMSLLVVFDASENNKSLQGSAL